MNIRPLLVVLAVAVLAVLVSPGPAGAHAPHLVDPSATVAKQERALERNVAHSRGAVTWIRNRRVSPVRCDASRHARAQRDVSRVDLEFCWHRAALAWQASSLDRVIAARARLAERSALGRALRDYSAAVRYLERAFGPQPFLWSCPRSEGSFGEWVWNNGDGGGPYPLSRYPTRPPGSSGAGGWLQFLSSTFWSVIDGGIAEARARGLRVPPSARSWYSPLGQALAAVEMLERGRRGEWHGATC